MGIVSTRDVADIFVFLNNKVKQQRLLSELHLIVNNKKAFFTK